MSERKIAFRVPRSRPGDRLTSRAWNHMADAVNEFLRPPRSRTTGDQSDSRLFFVPMQGRGVWEGRAENPDDPEQYIIARHQTQMVIQIQPEMVPMRGGDLWIISRHEDGSPWEGSPEAELFTDEVETWGFANGEVTPVV